MDKLTSRRAQSRAKPHLAIVPILCMLLFWAPIRAQLPLSDRAPASVLGGGRIPPLQQVQPTFIPTVRSASDTVAFLVVSQAVTAPRPEFIPQNFKDFQRDNRLIYANTPGPQIAVGMTTPYQVLGGKDLNLGDKSEPLDNSIAHGINGWMISASNGLIEIYQNGQPKLRKSFGNFLNRQILGPCDPKVLFDPYERRYIVFGQQCVGQELLSEIVLGVSISSNPMEGWNFYKLSGNPSQLPGEWFDYPKVGISADGIYISGNIFNASRDFQRAVVYQLSRTDALSGRLLNYRVWSGFDPATATLLPLTSAGVTASGPGMYFMSSRYTNESDRLDLYLISASVTDPAVELLHYEVNTLPYRFFAKAVQKDMPIDNGDIRMQDGFLLGDNAYFVFTSGDQNNFSRANLNVLHIPTLQNHSQLLGDEPDDSYAYPSVQLLPNPSGEPHLFVQYNTAGRSTLPSINCKACTMDGSRCSKEDKIKAGDGRIFGEDRWGDYTSVSRCSSCDDVLWISASYGSVTGRRQTWVGQVVPWGSLTDALDIRSVQPTSFSLNMSNRIHAGILYSTEVGGKSLLPFGDAYKGEVVFDISFPSANPSITSAFQVLDVDALKTIKEFDLNKKSTQP